MQYILYNCLSKMNSEKLSISLKRNVENRTNKKQEAPDTCCTDNDLICMNHFNKQYVVPTYFILLLNAFGNFFKIF